MGSSGSHQVPPDARALELEWLASIVEDSEDAIIAKDLTGRITSWNRAAEQMFGYAVEEIVGQPVLVLFPERLYEEEAVILDRIRRGDRIEHYETVRLHRDGREIDVALTVSPIRGPSGEVVGASKILRDVTEARRLGRELADLRHELMHVARLNDMSQMAAAFAHELNQPLSAVTMYLAGVQRVLLSGDADRAAEGCARALDQVERIGQIIERLRNFVSKREAERRREDLDGVIREALALVLLNREDIALAVHIAEDARQALIDRIQVQQVLVNLVRNAAEAMAGRGGARIEVSTRRATPGWIEIEISDTGPGLEPAVLDRIFRPFTSTKPEGMGVGLSLCRTIVESEGGKIYAGNCDRGGAWFRFTVAAG